LSGWADSKAKFTWNSFTLIYIHAFSCVNILEKSRFTCQIPGAFFTWVTPSFPDGSTAQLFGADNTLKLTCTHVIFNAPVK
jgi:hypothetical protein